MKIFFLWRACQNKTFHNETEQTFPNKSFNENLAGTHQIFFQGTSIFTGVLTKDQFLIDRWDFLDMPKFIFLVLIEFLSNNGWSWK